MARHPSEAEILDIIRRCNAGGQAVASEILSNLTDTYLIDVYEHVTLDEADDHRSWLIIEIVEIVCAPDYDPNMT